MQKYRSLVIVLGGILLSGSCAFSFQAMANNRLPVGRVAGDKELSPFYRWDKEMPEQPGQLLQEESIKPQADMAAAGKASRILYTSIDGRWGSGPISVSGTLFLPKGEAPKGGWPFIAWSHGTLGIADACAPSWTGFRPRDATYMNRWLEAGFAVVATDYQGLGGVGPHPYLYWQAEGRSILDSVRAALAMKPGLISDKVFLAGQSQGAGASMGAAILSSKYAPELNIHGLITTGLNSSFPDGPVSVSVRSSDNMLLSFVSGGLKDSAPEIDEILTDKGLVLLDTARTECTGEIKMKARELKLASLKDVFSIPLEQLQSMRLPVSDMPMTQVGFPILVATGLADETVTPQRQYAAVSALCAANNNVIWRPYDGLGHDGAMHGSFEDSLAFVQARLKGLDVSSTCSEIAPPGPPGKRKEGVSFNDD